MKKESNDFYKEGVDSVEKLWTILIGYLISATSKDFTIIMRF